MPSEHRPTEKEQKKPFTAIRMRIQFLGNEGRHLQDTELNLKGAKFYVREKR